MERQEKHMKRLIGSQSGITITELMVVIALSGFLMAAAAVGFATFFGKFNELSKMSQLQKEAFNCLQVIKNGVSIGTGPNQIFSGVASADSVVFEGVSPYSSASQSIKLYPPKSDIEHQADFVRFFYDGKCVRSTYLYGPIMPSSPIFIFPKPTRSREKGIVVTKLYFSKANDGMMNKVIKVELDAKIWIRKDFLTKKDVYKSVSYSTKMALAIK